MNESDRTVSTSTVYFGPPFDRAWLPDKTRILIESALDAAHVKISNGTVPRDRAVWETLQLWADALLGIYQVSIGLPPGLWSNAPANDPRYALMEPEIITENVSRRVRELVAEYAKYNLPIEQCDLDRLTEMVRHRTRGWLRSRGAEVFGVAISDAELLLPPVTRAGVTMAKRGGRDKDSQREQTKKRVKELCARYIRNRVTCRNLFISEGLDEQPKLYPSPWGMTWVKAFLLHRNRVDRYITGLLK